MVDHGRVERANEPEALSAEREANRVAAAAAEALKRSRQQVRNLHPAMHQCAFVCIETGGDLQQCMRACKA